MMTTGTFAGHSASIPITSSVISANFVEPLPEEIEMQHCCAPYRVLLALSRGVGYLTHPTRTRKQGYAARFFLFAAASVCLATGALAQEFKIEETTSAAQLRPDQLKPKMIAFSDQRDHKDTGPLQRFSDWAKNNALKKQQLTLYPGYGESGTSGQEAGAQRGVDKLYVYVAEARFLIPKPAAALDLQKHISLAALEKLEPAIKHKPITAAEVVPLKDAKNAANRHPQRAWCEGRSKSICIQSRYQLEGKLPMGVMLANKLRESEKQIPDFIEFQSELALLSGSEIDQAAVAKLTGIETPIAAVLEQNIFYVNQVMPFGKFLAVFQPSPSDANKTVTTAFMMLGVDGGLFEKKKEYEQVPVLRNLVPAQLLAGNSSFNSGTSISAGLPVYARTRIQAIAGMLESGIGTQ